MKYVLTICLVCAMCMVSGCLHIGYNPDTNEISYTRVLFDQNIEGLEAEVPNAMKLKITNQQSQLNEGFLTFLQTWLVSQQQQQKEMGLLLQRLYSMKGGE
jgi:hypothetical protein